MKNGGIICMMLLIVGICVVLAIGAVQEVSQQEKSVTKNDNIDEFEGATLDDTMADEISNAVDGYTLKSKVFEPPIGWKFCEFVEGVRTCVDIEIDVNGISPLRLMDFAGPKSGAEQKKGKIQVQATFLPQTAVDFPLMAEGNLLPDTDGGGGGEVSEPKDHWAAKIRAMEYLLLKDENSDTCAVDVEDGGPPPPDSVEVAIKADGTGSIQFQMVQGTGTYAWEIKKLVGEGEDDFRNGTLANADTKTETNIPAGFYILRVTQEQIERAIIFNVGEWIVCPRERDFSTEDVAGRIMISTFQDNLYHTRYQTEDRKVRIEAKRRVGSDYTATHTVYFRVVDPDDPSEHEPKNEMNDNLDESDQIKKKGFLTAAPTFTVPPAFPEVGSLSPDGLKTGMAVTTVINNGWETAAVILNITDRCAGDNYYVKAKLGAAQHDEAEYPADTVDDDCLKTYLLTAWKRMYYEIGRMAKFGIDGRPVANGVVAEQGTKSIRINKDDLKNPRINFMMGDARHILLFSNESEQHRAGQLCKIVGTPKEVEGDAGAAEVMIDADVALTYRYLPASQQHPYGVTVHIAEASGGQVELFNYSEDPQATLDIVYHPLYIEFHLLPNGGIMPYRVTIAGSLNWMDTGPDKFDIRMSMVEAMREYSQPWFSYREKRADDPYNETRGGVAPEQVWTGRKNTFHLVYAYKWNSRNQATGFSPFSCNAVFVFNNGGDFEIGHEHGHQFDLWNGTYPLSDNGGHNHCQDDDCIMKQLMPGDPRKKVVRTFCIPHAREGWNNQEWLGKRATKDGL